MRWTSSSIAALVFCACPIAPEPPEDTTLASFPDDFRWGTATAQWQVEGDEGTAGPVDSNWSRWLDDDRALLSQRNPDGNGFRSQFAAEAERAREIGLDTFRLSIDWSRVEPQPGTIDEAELDHLRDVLDALADQELDPVLTLWHWVVPPFIQDGASVDQMVDDPAFVLEHWDAYVRAVIPRVKDRVDTYTVLNEPFAMTSAGYLAGEFPPGRLLAVEDGTTFTLTLLAMQARAFDIIKELDDVDADGDGNASFVGFTQTANAFYPETPASENERFAAEHISYVFNDLFVRALVEGQLDVNLDGDTDDLDTIPVEGFQEELFGRTEFIGVQYYGPVRVRDDPLFRNLAPLYGLPLYEVDSYRDPEVPHNGMKREIYAAGFRDTLDIYAKWGLPIILTENGTTTNRPPLDEDSPAGEVDEAQAAMYIMEHLVEVGRALRDGMDIRGYYHWTLSDNFEWKEGLRQRFGAFSVDFDDAARPRTRTRVADVFADVIAAGEIDQALFERYALPSYPSDPSAAGLTGSEDVPGFSRIAPLELP